MLDDAFARLNAAASHAATSQHNQRPGPTPAQAVAGNYLKGRVRIHGLPIAVENDRNSIRTGESADGKAWANRLAAIYGEVEGTVGADGDRIDVFIGHFPETRAVWIINQGWPDGAFDEHKVMLGFQNEEAARDAYLMSFERGWTGLQSIHALSVDQLKWWLKHGDTKKRFAPSSLPLFDGATTMNPTPWNADAQPANATLQQVLYGIRVEDRDNLMLDAVSLADIYADPDVARQPQPVLDALVVEVNRLTRKMDVLQGAMSSAGGTLKVPSYEISDPVKLRGTMQVAVLFQLSDGQTITVWFHNPDTTPAKLMPLDELVSWKWMLNKKDITIVVAPERGRDLNVREVARRIMRLAERNMEAFRRANAKLAEKIEEGFRLDAEIDGLEKKLSSLQTKIEVARERNAEAKAAAAARMGDPTTADGYAAIKDDEAKLLARQDDLDAFFQGRIVEVRNALRVRGWEGETYMPLTKNDAKLDIHTKRVGGGGNVVGVTYYVTGLGGESPKIVDDLTLSDAALAETIDAYAPAPVIEPDPVADPAPDPAAQIAAAVAPPESDVLDARRAAHLAQLEAMSDADVHLVAMTAPLTLTVTPGAFKADVIAKIMNNHPDDIDAAIAAHEAYKAAPMPALEDPGVLPDGWTEASAGGMAAWNDPARGGIVDQNKQSGQWFIIFNNDQLIDSRGFANRAEAFAAFAEGLAKITPAIEPPAADVSPAVVALEIARDTAATNEPINRAEGDTEQADLEAQTVAGIDKALDILAQTETTPSAAEENPTNHDEWTSAVVAAIAAVEDISISDAEGIVGAQAFAMAQQWGMGSAPSAAANAILAASAPTAVAVEPQPKPESAVPPDATLDPAAPTATAPLTEVPNTGEAVTSAPPADDSGNVPPLPADPPVNPAPLDPQPESLTPENTPAPIEPGEPAPLAIDSAADRAYLESLIDGSGDLLAEDTFARLEPLFEKYAADPEMSALLERAATVYGDAAVAAAQSALSTQA